MLKKTMILVALLAAAFIVPRASLADSIVTTAEYTASSPTSLFSAPGATISLSFSIPAVLDPSLAATVPLTVDFDGTTTMGTANIQFFPSSGGGLFTITFDRFYIWSLFGDQVYDSSNTLIPGNYPLDLASSFYLAFTPPSVASASFSRGAVTVTASPVPEPSSMLFVAVGLIGIMLLARRQITRRTAQGGVV